MAQHYAHVFPRVGHGFDAHRLVEERALILGGVDIPYEKGLLGHSDADVLLHAITDALLGAAALGDIGQHFPDRDPRYKGISSLLLLEEAVKLLKSHGFAPLNIDATVIAQRPKLAAYIPQMRENIAKALDLPQEEVSRALDAVCAPVSLYDPVYSDGGDPLTVMDQVRDTKNTENAWMEHITLGNAFRQLGDREKQILSLRFYDGKTQMEVAGSLGISQAQVSRLEKGAIAALRKSVSVS